MASDDQVGGGGEEGGRLQDSDDLLTRAFRASHEAVALFRLSDGALAEVNGGWERVTGYTRAESGGVSYAALGLWADPDEYGQFKALLEAEGGVRDFEFSLRPKSGGGRHAAISADRVELDGEFYALAIMRDITRRRRAEQSLGETEERLRRQCRTLAEMARREVRSWSDFEQAVREVAEASGETLGVERVSVWLYDTTRSLIRCHYVWSAGGGDGEGAELPTSACPAYFSEMEHVRVVAADDAAADRRTSGFKDAYLAPLGIVSMLDAPLRLSGQTVGIICHEHLGEGREWTLDEQQFAGSMGDLLSLALESYERRRAERRLRESEESFRAVAETATDAIITIDEQSRVLFVNRAAERIFGHTREAMTGAHVSLLMPAHLRAGHEAGLGRYVETGRRHTSWERIELTGLHADGHEIPLELSFAEFFRGGQRFFTGIARDITERRRAEERMRGAEEQLRQAQKMEAVGRLAGGIAHDFNNLLTAVMGYSQLALSRLPADSTARPAVEEIAQAGQRAANLTAQLLAFSRKQILQPRVLDLNAVVSDMSRLLRRLIGEDIELVTALAPGLWHVLADPGQVEQVILNLAVNARDAMPQGGRLTVETANVELDEAYVLRHVATRSGPYALLAVTDTGAGMDAATQARVFEPFFTTKGQGKGTGLGLATVYGIIKQSGGYIWVYSEPGRGTTFKIYLPRAGPGGEGAAAQGADAPAAPRGSETVLLVEDDEMVRRLAREVLEANGYRVLEAAGGAEAFALAQNAGRQLDLLLTDVVMPGASGKELAEAVGALRPGLAVLYVSGYTDETIVHHGVLDAGTAFLQKPFTPDALARKVREVLDAARESRADTDPA
jgi:two-component system, cell cycle sensor histidine kinase and response regulator CckA